MWCIIVFVSLSLQNRGQGEDRTYEVSGARYSHCDAEAAQRHKNEKSKEMNRRQSDTNPAETKVQSENMAFNKSKCCDGHSLEGKIWV